VRDKRAIDRMLRAAGGAKAALKEHEEQCFARLTRRAVCNEAVAGYSK